MPKRDDYREALRSIRPEHWEDYLTRHSGLPGPRGNLELANAVADVGDDSQFVGWVASDDEYLALCGAIGLGEVVARGGRGRLGLLRHAANDHRWRVREGVAIGLQRLGDSDMRALLRVARDWSTGSPLEQRAAVAAVCEPRLLGRRSDVKQVVEILDDVTASLQQTADRRAEALRALRKGLGYCWSVALAADLESGRPTFERWVGAAAGDSDIRWIVKENLGKKRLAALDPAWVVACRARITR